MNIAVRYQSRGGNTKAVADIIAETLGVTAETLETTLAEKADILFLGGGVYAWDVDKTLKAYLESLDPEKIGQIVAFSTTGAMDTAIKKITEYATKASMKVNDNSLCLKIMLQGHAVFKREGGHLKDEQIAKIKAFARSVVGAR